MEYFKCVVFIMLSILNVFEEVDGNCVLSLSTDFGDPQPVLLRSGHQVRRASHSAVVGYEFLRPNTSKSVTLRRGETLVAACPGRGKYIVLGNETTDVSEVKARCLSNNIFVVGRWTGAFKDIRCNMPPWYTAEDTNETCSGGHRIYRVGYKVREQFYKLYEACFDRHRLTTLYVKHHVTPTSIYIQTGGPRPNFIEGDLFGKTSMSKLYKTSAQRVKFNALLGADMDKEYISKTQYLTRGHLAARADFPLRVGQRASFHYVNTAPQWMRGNAGDWAALEDAVRRRVHSYGATLAVYTGAHGVLTLRNAGGTSTEIYLDVDANNNGVVPVPLYLYKVVHDYRRKTATAFVSINKPFYNSSDVRQVVFCEDVCRDSPNYSWLRWRANDGTYSFCCDYHQFLNEVRHFPRLDIVGQFY